MRSADGVPHRLRLARARRNRGFRFRAVPRDVPEVYREVSLDNPFDAPLLGGPVASMSMARCCSPLRSPPPIAADCSGRARRGGAGSGGAERGVKEDHAGLLRGSVAVEHQISIEPPLSLGRPIEVELLERAPVSDDDDLGDRCSPRPTLKSEPYTQEERSAPIRRRPALDRAARRG